jgi:hypothetical protein
MNIVPLLKDQWGKQYDFSNGQNKSFLDYQLPMDIAKTLIPPQPKTNISVRKGGFNNTTNSNIRHTGGNKNNPPKKVTLPDASSFPPVGNTPKTETRQYQGYTYIKGNDGKWHRQG